MRCERVPMWCWISDNMLHSPAVFLVRYHQRLERVSASGHYRLVVNDIRLNPPELKRVEIIKTVSCWRRHSVWQSCFWCRTSTSATHVTSTPAILVTFTALYTRYVHTYKLDCQLLIATATSRLKPGPQRRTVLSSCTPLTPTHLILTYLPKNSA